MRFVNLIRSNSKSEDSCESIIKYKCGPNFVLNRRDDFEIMFRSQGKIFLFRFWLTFCLDPGSYAMALIFAKCPQAICRPLIDIHKKFLEGTIEDSVRFSLEEAIIPLKTRDLSFDPKDENIKDVLFKCLKTAFGAALCKLFHSWLNAVEVYSSFPCYWKTPKEYLKPNFKPGLLEKYLLRHWKNHLLLLLEVDVKQIPWFLNELDSEATDNDVFEREISLVDYRIIKILQIYSENDRKRILNSDEQLRVEWGEEECKRENISFYLLNRVFKKREGNISKDVKKQKIKNCSEKKCKGDLIKCSCCKNIIVKKLFRECQQCIDKNWLPVRCYCNDNCQLEHWTQRHRIEHSDMNSLTQTR